MEINRQRFRDIKRKIANGNLNSFKELLNNIYDEAYKEMMTKGICDVKDALMSSIKEVLKSEFKIGETRFNRFNDALEKLLDDYDVIKEKISTDESIKNLEVTEQDKINLMIILCVRQFLININSISNGLYAEKNIKLNIDSSLKAIVSLENMVSSRLSKQDIEDIFTRASNSFLYVLPKEELEEKNILINCDVFETKMFYEDKVLSFKSGMDNGLIVDTIKKLLSKNKYKVVILNSKYNNRNDLLKHILQDNNIVVTEKL